MPAKFCVKSGCHEVAIGAARSRDHCRGHYNADVLAGVELTKVEVLAGRVTDARTQVSQGKGQVVEVDPAETNVAGLVAAGVAKVVAGKPAKAEQKG